MTIQQRAQQKRSRGEKRQAGWVLKGRWELSRPERGKEAALLTCRSRPLV